MAAPGGAKERARQEFARWMRLGSASSRVARLNAQDWGFDETFNLRQVRGGTAALPVRAERLNWFRNK